MTRQRWLREKRETTSRRWSAGTCFAKALPNTILGLGHVSEILGGLTSYVRVVQARFAYRRRWDSVVLLWIFSEILPAWDVVGEVG